MIIIHPRRNHYHTVVHKLPGRNMLDCSDVGTIYKENSLTIDDYSDDLSDAILHPWLSPAYEAALARSVFELAKHQLLQFSIISIFHEIDSLISVIREFINGV